MKRIYQRFITMLIVISVLMSTVLPTRNLTYATANVNDKEETANLLERALAGFITVGGITLYGLVCLSTGSSDDGPVTIESLFFNRYSKTRLSLFDDMNGTGENEYLTNLKDNINEIYDFFVDIALVVYLIMLVYIGIRILLNAGTQKNAKYKEFTFYWVQGIAILFLFPFVMKYTIMINDAFVQYIYANKDEIFSIGDAVQEEVTAGVELTGVADSDKGLQNAGSIVDNIKETFMDGSDYMSEMCKKALLEGWLVYALCFVIMVKQLIGLIIIYFKRLITIIFLIVVFPLVMISFAIDKLGDGKSQAFGNWCKEFVLNVFVQSFHAIVYVIGMALILKLGEGGNISDNWLLVLILITFISKGDDLLEHIFGVTGGGGETVKGVGQTMLETKGAIEVAKSASKFVSNTVGSNSSLAALGRNVGKLADHGQDWYMARTSTANAVMQSYIDEKYAPLPTEAFTSEMVDPSQIQTNLSEEQKKEIMDRMLSIMEIEDETEREAALNEFRNELEADPEALKFIEGLLKINHPLGAGGLVEITLNERIEIILREMRNGKLAQNKELINKLKMVNAVKFKKPEHSVTSGLSGLSGLKGKTALAAGAAATGAVVAKTMSTKGKTTGTGGKRVPNNRYSGRFKQPTAMEKVMQHRQSQMPKPKQTFKQKMYMKSNQVSNRVKATFDIRNMEKTAMSDMRELRRLENILKKNFSKLTPEEQQKIQNRIAFLKSRDSVAALRRRREEYAKRGIHFVGVGRTQFSLNMKAEARSLKGDFSADWQDIKKFSAKYNGKALNDRRIANKKARGFAREASELKKKRLNGQLSVAEKERLKDLEKFIYDYNKGYDHLFKGGKERNTRAYRILNRNTNKVAIKEAKRAIELRKHADRMRAVGATDKADAMMKEVNALEKRVMRTRGQAVSRTTKLRKPNRAQKILEREHQKYSLEKLRDVRSKKPKNLSEQERKILESSNAFRQQLRENGVYLKNSNRVETQYNKTYQMSRKQERAAINSIKKERRKIAGQMVTDRVFRNTTSDYSEERRKIAETSESLRRRGIIIRESRMLNYVDKKTNDIQHRDERKNKKKAANETLKQENRNTYNARKELNKRQKDAQKALNTARDNVRRAKTSAERAAAVAEERNVVERMRGIQHETDNLMARNRETRRKIREDGIVLSSRAMKNSIKLERGMQEEIAIRYRRDMKRERALDRKYERAEIHEEGLNRKSDRRERIIDRGLDSKITLVRRLAEDKKVKREQALLDGAPKGETGLLARRMSDAMERAERISSDRETAALLRSVSQDSVRANNVVPLRVNDSGSEAFHKLLTTPNRVREGAIELRDSAVSKVNTVVDNTKKAASDFQYAVSDLFTPIDTSSMHLSPEVMELARNRVVEERPKVTISGRYKAPEETPDHALPATKNSTYSHERETVIVVRDSDDSYVGSLKGKNVVSVNSQKDYDAAKKIVSDVKAEVARDSKGSSASGKTIDDDSAQKAMVLASAVVAINQSYLGDYTAAEIVAHIDSIKAIMKDVKPGSPEYHVCNKILSKLEYDLNDYESNVRIQVLNDPSLIGDSDPNKRTIMDASISHVKALPSDEVLLSMLRYDPGDLHEDHAPIVKDSRISHSVGSFVATGIRTGYDESDLRSTFMYGLKEKERQATIEAGEKNMSASRSAMKQDVIDTAVSAKDAALDLAIGIPMAVSTGFMAAGMGSSANKKSGMYTLQSAAAGFTGASLADKTYRDTKNFVENRVEDATNLVVDTYRAALKKNNNSSKK